MTEQEEYFYQAKYWYDMLNDQKREEFHNWYRLQFDDGTKLEVNEKEREKLLDWWNVLLTYMDVPIHIDHHKLANKLGYDSPAQNQSKET